MQELGKQVFLPENFIFEKYAAIDDKIETDEEFLEGSIISSLLNHDQDISNSFNGETDKAPELPPTLKEIKDPISFLQFLLE